MRRMIRRSRLGILLLVWSACAGTAAAQEVVEYYVTDAVGSTRVVFGADGTVKGRADYLPFGEEMPAANVPEERFTGQERDGEAGLDYFHARSYQVRTGRFSAVDPVSGGLADPQRWNRYAYALNNPLSFTDSTGMWSDTPSGSIPIGIPEGAFLFHTQNEPLGAAGWWYLSTWRGWRGFADFFNPPDDCARFLCADAGGGGGGGGGGNGDAGGGDGGSGGGDGGNGDSGQGGGGAGGPAPPPTPPCALIRNCAPGPVFQAVPPPPPKPMPQLSAVNPILYAGVSGTLIAGVGIKGSFGAYWEGCCMPKGVFLSLGGGVGLSAGGGPMIGYYRDGIATFRGNSVAISAGGALGSMTLYHPPSDPQYLSGVEVGAAAWGHLKGGLDYGGAYTWASGR